MAIAMPPKLPSTSGTDPGFQVGDTTPESNVNGTGRGSSSETGAVPPPPSPPPGVVIVDSQPLPEDPGAAASEMEDILKKIQDDPNLRETLMAAIGSGANAEEIAALMIKLSNMSREEVLDQRLQARSAARSDLQGAAAEMKEAATKQFAAAVVSAVVAGISAGVSLGASVSSIKSSAQAINTSKQANTAERLASETKATGDSIAPELKETSKNLGALAESQTLAARRTADIGTAISRIGTGVGDLISGALQGDAKIDDSQGKLKEASATDEQAAADVTKKAMDDIEEMVKSAIQFLKAMQSAEVDLMASMTRV